MSTESFRLSPQQEELWLARPSGPDDRTQAVVGISGPLDVQALRAALEALVQRHEVLRTTFTHQSGLRLPLQTVHSELPPAWREGDLRAASDDQGSRRLEELLRDELTCALDLEHGPLVSARLAACDEERRVLALTCSSLCVDASSLPALLGELAGLYAGEEGAAEDPLQYADVAEWQHELLSEGEDLRAAQGFWARFDGATPPGVPFARASGSPAALARVEMTVEPSVARGIAEQVQRYGSSPALFVQAGWHALLARTCGEDEVAVALVTGERRHPELEGAVGAFARPLPIRTQTESADTFAELLERLTRAREEAQAWEQYLPAGASAELSVGFSARPAFRARAGAIELALEDVNTFGGQYRLLLTCAADDESLSVQLSYDPAALDQRHAERLVRELGCLLRGAATEPGSAIGKLELLVQQDRDELLVSFNDTVADVPASRVEQLFAAAATANPERIAVTDESSSVTYAALDARANQLANRLRAAGVEQDSVVGLCTDRSVDMVVGLLGILKAGAGYLPLHFEHPAARLAHQLQETDARAVVTQSALEERLPEFGGELIRLDGDRAALDAESPAAPRSSASAEAVVYVIYTSGSTGRPKGVAVTQANLVNYVTDMTARLDAGSTPLSFGLVTAISTDLGNTSVFPSLCSGGTLVLVPPATAADPGALAAQLETSPVDVLKITPSHLSALLAGGDSRLLPRHTLVLGGERVGWELVDRVRELGSCRIFNHYGPTETTVGSCVFPVPDGRGEHRAAGVPIGRPLANTRCYVLDEWCEPVPLGAPGRLHIAGAGVARGYVGQEALTAERFLPDPFDATGGRMYDTGDLARWLSDGTLEFLGRVDDQVKIRGFRVEPAEVDAVLRGHPAVREGVVVTREDAGDPHLVAYCVAEAQAGEPELRDYLAERVPDYMLPTAIVLLEELPLTASGKVDRLALPEPLREAGGENGYVPPGTPIEEAVAAIWSKVLGVERVGVEDNFFTLGGHSLLATQVIAQVRTDFSIDLPLHSVFTSPTVAALSSEIVNTMSSDGDETAKLMAELEGLSNDEAERLLAEGLSTLDQEG